MKLTPFVAGIVIAIVALPMLVAAAGCGDHAGERAESFPSADTSTPASPGRPVLNVQFLGAADLSDESKSSLADLIESIQYGHL